MKNAIFTIVAAGLLLTGNALAAAKGCKWSDPDKLREHLKTHITYPAKGKDVKLACKKEMPDEFSAAERACVDKTIKDDAEFKSPEQLMKALGVNPS